MKVVPLITVGLILCIAFLCPIQAKKKQKPKFCVGKDGNRYKEGEGYHVNDGKACIQYSCVKKNKNKFVMKKGKCATVDGGWSSWSSWSDCSGTCGTATKTRKRSCSSPAPSNGGEHCPGMDEEVEECSNPPCGLVGNVNVTALELNVQSLNDSMQTLQATMQSVLEMMTALQSTADKQESCLGDVNSVSCPSSKGGKISVIDAIMKNKNTIESHHPGPSSTMPTPEEKKEFSTVVVENGQIFEQKDAFDPNTGEVSLVVPAHGNVEEATIIMDTDSKLLMRSTETTCRIESIPEEVNPNDIKDSNSTKPITEDIEKKSYSLVFDAGTATGDEATKLSPTMPKECANKTIKKTEQKKVYKETFEKFINGSVITLELGQRRKRDTSSCDKPAKVCVSRPLHGCWRWPYGSGDSLHSISGNGFCVPCCNSTTSTADLCSCTELTSLEKIEQCLGSAGQNGSCPNGFENVCGHCLVDTDVGVNVSDCGGSCPDGRYLCGDECWPTWMKNNLVECSATGKCQDTRKSSTLSCNGTCLEEDRFLCGGECWRNRYKDSRWDCNGICQDKSTPCNDVNCPDGRFLCESNCHRDEYKSYTKYCDGNCIWNSKPCNGSCDEGYALCNNKDLYYDYYNYYYHEYYGYNYNYETEECMDLSRVWLCDGKCHDKSKPCDGKCDEGYTLCNGLDEYERCLKSSSIRDCEGSCLYKEYPCNGTCPEGYILCDDSCVDLNSTDIWESYWNCSGKCQSKTTSCNETCDPGYTFCNDRCYSYTPSNTWKCDGKCQSKNTACNETCDTGYTFCNDRCYQYTPLNTWECDGKCQYKTIACNETCDDGYTFCNDRCYSSPPLNTWECDKKCQFKTMPCNGSCPDGYVNCNGRCKDNYRICDGKCLHKVNKCNGTCSEGYIDCDRGCKSVDYYKLCLGKCIDTATDCIDTCQAGNTTMVVGETMEMGCQMFECTMKLAESYWDQHSAVLVTTNVTTPECTN